MEEGWVSSYNNIWWNVLWNAATALNEAVSSYTNIYLQYDGVGHDAVAIYFAARGKDAVDTYGATVFDLHVVADMYFVHQVVVVAYASASVSLVASGNNYVFANYVVIANGNGNGCSFLKACGLWHGAYHYVLEDAVVIAHSGAVEYAGVWHDDTIVANHYIFLHVCKGKDIYVLPNLSAGLNMC